MTREQIIQHCEELQKKEDEKPTPGSIGIAVEVKFFLQPDNGKLVLWRVEAWEREGSIFEVIAKED